jgi:hypothetical protein
MCCGVPEDMYDLVVVADSERQLAPALAEAFLARDRRERVAVVLPCMSTRHPEVQRLRRSLDLSEITLIEGHAARDADPHYLDVDGRLVYGESIITLTAAKAFENTS